MSTNQKYGISKELFEQMLNIFINDQFIDEVFLFGSRALGTYHNGSDIDISIKGKQLTINNVLAISTQVDDLYLPYQLDIIIYESINEPALKEHIDNNGIRLFKR